MKRNAWVMLGLAMALVLFSGPARADQVLYYTNLGGGTIQEVDVTAATNTAVLTGLSGADSLIFSNPTTLVFTEVFAGQLQTAPIPGGTVTTLISGGLSIPQDLALDPSGTSVVVSDSGNDALLRENLAGGAPTLLATFSVEPTGVAYDASGHLFVLVGNQIDQLNPVTGAVIKTLSLPAGTDGLTYDPVSGKLWASTFGGVIEIDTGLTTATEINCPVSSTVCVSGTDRLDGIEADGIGNLDIANTDKNYIDVFNIAGGTFSSLVSAPGIDDLAPLVGSGSAVTTPEPGTLTMLGAGLLGLGLWGFRRKLSAASIGMGPVRAA